MQLFQEFKESHGVYIPVERTRVVDPKTRVVSVKKAPAFYGLVFCPLRNAKDLRRKVVQSFRLRQLFYEQTGNPRTVEVDELVRMQSLLNSEFDGKKGLLVHGLPDEGEVWFEVGDKVDLTDCMLPGVTGVVQRINADGMVRVQLGGGMQYLQVHKGKLRKM
jgi:transcription antitermination factor NusG